MQVVDHKLNTNILKNNAEKLHFLHFIYIENEKLCY